ncbi:MAG: dihydrodipicolinate reductase [Planctomycetota bacterium]
MQPLRVLVQGLGPIGARVAALVHERPDLVLVAAVDVDPTKVGRPVGGLFPEPVAGGPVIEAALDSAIAAGAPDVAIQCTGSRVPDVAGQLEALIAAGLPVASSCEELLWPWLSHPDLAEALDRAALARGVAVLGTGVNPGFVCDALPAFASAVLTRVRGVRCERRLDAATRREPFQRKIGAGLTVEEFTALRDRGRLGHVGLRESIAMLGAALGFALDRIEEEVEPIVADRHLRTEWLDVPAGRVAGLVDRGRGSEGGEVRVEVELRLHVGCADPADELHFDADPPLSVVLPGGTPGDGATAAMLVHAALRLGELRPGLRTMLDLPIPCLGRLADRGRDPKE